MRFIAASFAALPKRAVFGGLLGAQVAAHFSTGFAVVPGRCSICGRPLAGANGRGVSAGFIEILLP